MDDQNPNQQTSDEASSEEAVENEQQTSPEEAGSTSSASAKVLTIPSNAMAKIKREERERGRKAAITELETQAKKAGFSTWEEMMQAARSMKDTAARTAPQRQEASSTPNESASPEYQRAARRAEKERERALEEVKRLNKARANEEKRRKEAEQRVQAMEAEMTLRTAAVRAGVQDVDYALELLRRKINGKSADELKSFSEDDFFAKDLRSSHPYLYGVTDVPANTAPNASKDAPKPPAPVGKPTSMPAPNPGNGGNGSSIDARKLSPQEYTELLQRYGIKNPSLGI